MLIIAEVGSNFTCQDDCFESIVAAKKAGADAVKFQLYSHKELYGLSGQPMTGELPRDWIPHLANLCSALDIEFMCSAFSPSGLQFLDPYVKRHKIASAELTHIDMLKIAKISGKEILLSTGGSPLPEIAHSLSYLDVNRTTLLYCVASYPAKNIRLDGILELFDHFQIPVGYSCHSPEWVHCYYATQYYGAEVIEKHFKLRDMATPDNDHAIKPDEFAEMVKAIHSEKMGIRFPDPSETEMVSIHKRRFREDLGGYFRGKA